MSDLIDRLAQALTDPEAARIMDVRRGRVHVPIPPSDVRGLAPGVRLLANGVKIEYSTMYAGNIDHRAFLLRHPGGFVGLHTDDGRLHKMLPPEVNHSSQPRWSRKQPTVFRYLYLNEIRELDVANDRIRTVRKFGEFPNVNGLGESDTSIDDDHIVLCSGLEVFIYSFSADKIIEQFTAPAAFNNLYLTSENQVIVGFNAGGHRLYENGAYRVTGAALGHCDTSSDKDGRAVFCWANSADDTGANRNAALAGCPNGIVKVDVATGKQTCLARLDWSLACHVSLSDRATHALVSTYGPSESTVQYANENLLVALDGSGVRSLGKHGAIVTDYESQPHTSISPDGTRFAWNVNGDAYVGTI